MLSRLLPFGVFLLLAALLYAGVRLSGARNPNDIPSPLIGKPAPAFTLPDLHDPGQTIDSENLRGAPYLLNVWGSWCPACRDEHPLITELARTGRIRVVGYNYKDQREDALRWLGQFGDPYAAIVADEDGRTALDWGIYGAPETFLIDAEGIVRYKHIGPLSVAAIEKEILTRLGNLPLAVRGEPVEP